MVDIGAKDVTDRMAIARATVNMKPETVEAIRRHALVKGDVLSAARIAGIMAAKRTDELIPLCHAIPLTSMDVDINVVSSGTVEIRATSRTRGQTGVEMEALTAASIAALTIYDMCKAIDRGMTITQVRLEHKSGGRSGVWTPDSEERVP